MRSLAEVRDLAVDSICMERDDLDKKDVRLSVQCYMCAFLWQQCVFIMAGTMILGMAVHGNYENSIWVFQAIAIGSPVIVNVALYLAKYITRNCTVRFGFVHNAVLSTLNPFGILYVASDILFMFCCLTYLICTLVVY